jgi:phage-related protein
MSFDAGSIIARAEIRQDQFNRDLDSMEARARRFENEQHQVKFVASFNQSDISRARKAFATLDQQLSRDAASRLRSGGNGSILGTLNSLFSTQQIAGAPTPQQASQQGLLGRMLRQLGPSGGGGGGSLLGSLIGSLAGGRSSANAMAAADQAAQRSLLSSLTRQGNIFSGGVPGGGGPSGGRGFFGNLAGGIGPGILGLGLKTSGILGLGGSLLGALPALTGPLAALGVAGVGAGALGVAFKGANQQVAPLLQLQQQIQQAQLTATTPYQKQQLAAQQASLAQAVGKLPAAQQSLFKSQSQMSNWWQNFTAGLAPTFAKALAPIPGLLRGLPLKQFFSSAFTLLNPMIKGLFDLAHMVLPLLGQAFRAAAPFIRPLIDGIGMLVKGLLQGLVPLIRFAGPAVKVFAQILGSLGRELGMMFKDFAPVAAQSAVILKALFGVLNGLFPIIGKLVAVFARTLAPVFKVFAQAIKQLEPVLTIIGKVIGELAAAILGDLAVAFSAIAHLLIDISPSLKILANVLGQVFKTLENSGLFAVLGNALEKTVRPLASLINALIIGLAPVLPVIIKLISSLAGSALNLFVTAIKVLVPIALQLINDVLKPLLPAVKALVPVISAMARLLATGLGAVLTAIAPLLAKLAPYILAVVLAMKAWAIIQGILDIALNANPIGLIVIAVAALVIAITELVTHWKTVWGAVKSIALDAWHFIDNDVIHPLMQAFDAFNNFIALWTDRVALVLAHWAQTVLGIVRTAFGWLPNWLPGAKTIKDGLNAAANAISGFISSTQANLDKLTSKPYNLKFAVVLPPGAHQITGKLLPGQAKGTPGAPRGWSWVGEQGPELVNFRGGEAVMSHPQSMAVTRGFAAGTGMLTVHLSAPSISAIASTFSSIVGAIVHSIQSRYVVPVTQALGGFGGHGVTPSGPIQAYAKRLVTAVWGASQWPFFADVVNRESGWNVSATNPTSGAYGIPQALPPGKMASAGSDWRTNPFTQIKWMVGYILSRWRTPAGADANEVSQHWYDGGGWLLPGATVARNSTGMREAVITPSQSQAFTMLARVAEGMTARNDYLAKRQIAEVLNIMLPEGTSVAQAMSELTFRMRVAEQQGFAGALP